MSNLSNLEGQAVLVTGAAGCIGAWTIKLLTEIGAVPVVFDLTDNRQRLELIMDDSQSVTWELGDITDFDRLQAVADKYNVEAIIHLAALQVPFCKADPVGSTKINVIGSTHILELARQRGITRLSYASSIAAQAMGDNDWLPPCMAHIKSAPNKCLPFIGRIGEYPASVSAPQLFMVLDETKV